MLKVSIKEMKTKRIFINFILVLKYMVSLWIAGEYLMKIDIHILLTQSYN